MNVTNENTGKQKRCGRLGQTCKKNRILAAIVLMGLLGSCGCGSSGPYKIKGETMLTLEQAMEHATTVDDLWALWHQASGGVFTSYDRLAIEQEILSVSSQSRDIGTLQHLHHSGSSEEIRNEAAGIIRKYEREREGEAKRRREAQRLQHEKKVEEFCVALAKSRQRLIQEAGGRLNDKTIEEVKRLFDDWLEPEGPFKCNNYEGVLYIHEDTHAVMYDFALQIQDLPELFGVSTFYSAFGQPQRKQLISGNDVFGGPDQYYFYYQCKDGTVQIQIDAKSLSKDDMVLVSSLNVF